MERKIKRRASGGSEIDINDRFEYLLHVFVRLPRTFLFELNAGKSDLSTDTQHTPFTRPSATLPLQSHVLGFQFEY